MVIESHTGFMLFDPLYEGSASLAYVELLAVGTWDLVDDILETGRGTGGFDMRQ